MPFLNWLKQHLVYDVIHGKSRLIELPFSASIEDALNLMLSKNIVAIPVAAPPGDWIGAGGSSVVQTDASGTPKKHYIGMATIFDVLIHLSDKESESNLDSALQLPISSIIGHSIEGLTLWTISPSSPLLDAIDSLGKGVHRALVPKESICKSSDATNFKTGLVIEQIAPFYRMLTQKDVVSFIFNHATELGGLLNLTVGETGAVRDSVFAVFKSMKGQGRRIIGTLSASDLRGCSAQILTKLRHLTVVEFLQRKIYADEHGLNAAFGNGSLGTPNQKLGDSGPEVLCESPKVSGIRSSVTCSINSSLYQVMELALSNRVHRVWVTEELDPTVLLGIVSYSDVLRTLHNLALSNSAGAKGEMVIVC